MNILLIGPPGSGKGTQGERLAARLGLEHIATGDLLRAEVAAGTPLGRHVEDIMVRGELVSDSVILQLVRERTIAAARGAGYLLDGFPRSVEQAEQARRSTGDPAVRADAVFYLDVPRAELVRRILARAAVEDRADDNVETVGNRLRVFEEATRPLVDYYREQHLLHVVDAAAPPNDVTAAILAVVDRIGRPAQRP